MSVRITAAIAAILLLAYGAGLFLIGDVGGSFSSADALLSIVLIIPFLGLNLGIAVLLGMKRFRAFNLGRFIAPFLYAAEHRDPAGGSATPTLTAILAASLGSFALGADDGLGSDPAEDPLDRPGTGDRQPPDRRLRSARGDREHIDDHRRACRPAAGRAR